MTASQLDRVVTAVNLAGLPLLLYVDGRGPFTSRVLALTATSATEVVIRGVPDERFVLGGFLSQRTFVTAPALLLAQLTECLVRLGRDLKTPAVSLFAWAPIPSSVGTFVSIAQHRRTTERQFARAGLSGVAPLINGARLARAWVMADDDRVTLGLVAAHTGYDSERSLTEHCRRYVGSPFRRAQGHFTTEAFVARIAERMRGALPRAAAVHSGKHAHLVDSPMAG